MLARALAARLDRLGVHYGWVIVAVTLCVSVTTAGAIGVPGALILPLTKEYGWDIGQISSALALRLVLFGLDGAVRGRADRTLRHPQHRPYRSRDDHPRPARRRLACATSGSWYYHGASSLASGPG